MGTRSMPSMQFLRRWNEPLVALAAMVGANLVMKVLDLTLSNHQDGFWAAIEIGWLAAIICGEALWIVWGGIGLLWRLIIVGLGVMSSYVFWLARDRIVLLIIISITLLSSILLALPRWFGFRRCWLSAGGMSQASFGTRQFSMLDIFLWTTSIALLAGIAHWTDLSLYEIVEDFMFDFRWSIRLAICGCAAVWAILSIHGRIPFRLLIAALIVISTAWVTKANDVVFSQTVDLMAPPISFFYLCAGLYFFRRQGLRLVGPWAIRKFESARSAHAPSDALLKDA